MNVNKRYPVGDLSYPYGGCVLNPIRLKDTQNYTPIMKMFSYLAGVNW